MAAQALVFSAGLAVGAGAVWLTRPTPASAAPSPTSSHASDHSKLRSPSASPRTADTGGELLKFGNPGPVSDLFLRQAYAVGYDRRTRNPAWTAEHLTAENIRRPPALPGGDSPDRSNSSFKEDDGLPELFRAKLSDYFRSGYDRGHMTPAADAKRSQDAMDETFILSNIAPQVGEGFNRDYWAHFEDFTRRLTTSFPNVYVFTLPLYLPKFDPATRKNIVSYEVIGNPPNVAVPTHFAKVIYSTNSTPASSGYLSAFVLPNAVIPNHKPLSEFLVPVEAVERASGLELFGSDIKKSAGNLCGKVKCEILVRQFDDARKRIEAPQGDGGRRGRPIRSETV